MRRRRSRRAALRRAARASSSPRRARPGGSSTVVCTDYGASGAGVSAGFAAARLRDAHGELAGQRALAGAAADLAVGEAARLEVEQGAIGVAEAAGLVGLDLRRV